MMVDLGLAHCGACQISQNVSHVFKAEAPMKLLDSAVPMRNQQFYPTNVVPFATFLQPSSLFLLSVAFRSLDLP